ncbi:MAG: RHS repeat-associated core domain-containing protein [Actinomycetia bacterium]|nr:RHS repeat-associated core domain-containing protein [Actinomycetes bacterium]
MSSPRSTWLKLPTVIGLASVVAAAVMVGSAAAPPAAQGAAGMAAEPSVHGSEDFVRGPNNDLIGTNAGSDWTWWSSDAHGDATVGVDDDGALVGSVEFDPFGVRSSSAGLTSSLGFQGDLTDGGSGTVWMGARWFDPTRAGFVSRDSFAGRPSEPGSLNRYAYAEGNPLSRWDPSGYEAEPRDDGSTKALVWSNTPTTTWAPVGPPPPKTGWSLSRFKQGAVDAITAPVRLAWRAYMDLVLCAAGPEEHGCFETAKQVGRGFVEMAKNPGAFIEECLNDKSYCAGAILGGAALSLGTAKLVTTVFKYVSEVRQATRLIDNLDEVAEIANVTEHIPANPTAARFVADGDGVITDLVGEATNRGPDFVAGPIGSQPPVPVSQSRMAAGFDDAGFPSTPTASPGTSYTLPDGSKVRLMEPTSQAPRRASFTNANDGYVNPFTGKPVQPPAPPGVSMKEWVRLNTHVEQTP